MRDSWRIWLVDRYDWYGFPHSRTTFSIWGRLKINKNQYVVNYFLISQFFALFFSNFVTITNSYDCFFVLFIICISDLLLFMSSSSVWVYFIIYFRSKRCLPSVIKFTEVLGFHPHDRINLDRIHFYFDTIKMFSRLLHLFLM